LEDPQTWVSDIVKMCCTTLIDSSRSGELLIAEVTSRFTNIQQFLDLVSSIGFRLKSKVGLSIPGRFAQTDYLFSTIQDESNSHFILLEFTKVARTAKTEQEWTRLLSKREVLKPCEYKRR
jgi:ribosomal RNA-processing protein 8